MTFPPRFDVFLSFSQRDKALAEAVHAFLTTVGLRVFFSPHPVDGLTVGAQWFPNLLQALDGSDAILVLATPSSVAEHWPVFEAGAVAVRHAGGKASPVITALAGVGPGALPRPLQALQAFDLHSGRTDVFQRIGAAFGRTLADSPEALAAFEVVESALRAVAPKSVSFKAGVLALTETWRFQLAKAIDNFVAELAREPSASRMSGGEIVARARSFDAWVADFDEVAHSLVVNGRWGDAQHQFSKLLTGLARSCHSEGPAQRGDFDVRRIVAWRTVLRIVRRVGESGTAQQIQGFLGERHRFQAQDGARSEPIGCAIPPVERLDELAKAAGTGRSPLWAYSDLFEPRETEDRQALAQADLTLAFWVASEELRLAGREFPEGEAVRGRWVPFLGAPDVGQGIDGLSQSLRELREFNRFAEVLEIHPHELRKNWETLSQTVFANFSANLTWNGGGVWPTARQLPREPEPF